MLGEQSLSPWISEVPEPLRPRLLTRWRDFIAATPEFEPTSDPTPQWLSQLPRVWACSEFVANSCIRHPELLADLVQSGDLTRPQLPGTVTKKASGVLSAIGGDHDLMSRIRMFRRCEMVRLAWRDLSGDANLHEVMATMTELADACLQLALDHLYREAVESWGVPIGADIRSAVQLSVIALGKLGGGELNFSSDVDLMFAYADEGRTTGKPSISNHEFFTRLARRVIKVIDETTEDGFVFRMDLRLRPNGESGPLALSFDAMEHYYQTHGRDWERYALIKARANAGDTEAGEELLARLRPFVYRKYLDYGAFESIRSMKALIEAEIKRKGIANNIKVGSGGIREIEFIAQSFQLTRGGRERLLQTPRLCQALSRLAELRILSEHKTTQLAEAYQYLRAVEHRLQMVADEQNHTLPSDSIEQQRLAYAVGHDDWHSFRAALNAVMAGVHRQFEEVFAIPEHTRSHPQEQALTEFWLDAGDPQLANEALRRVGFADPQAAAGLLHRLRTGPMYRAYSTWARERLDRLMPRLIVAVGLSSDPMIALTRLIDLLHSIGRRAAYLALLAENPMVLDQLVKLACVSPWVSSWICQHPLLLDELLYPASSYQPAAPEELASEFARHLNQTPPDDLEAQMDILREVRHGHVLRVAAADLAERIDAQQVAAQLSAVADAALKYSLAVAHRSLDSKLADKKAGQTLTLEEPGFAVIAYGKLGSEELGYNSDLDLIFLYDTDAIADRRSDTLRTIPDSQYAVRLGQRLVHVLTTRTAAGSLYEIDMRLRPSGRSGPLVTAVEAFQSYQLERAWTWEHQALVRARAVTGDDSLGRQFEQIRRSILCQHRDPETLRKDVAEMRSKMMSSHVSRVEGFDVKHDHGGIVDIEFIVQYYVLLRAADHPEITRYRSTIKLLEALAEVGVLSERTMRTVRDIYRRYLAAEHHLQLADQSVLVEHGEFAKLRHEIAQAWDNTFNG